MHEVAINLIKKLSGFFRALLITIEKMRKYYKRHSKEEQVKEEAKELIQKLAEQAH